jgi:CxxC-x17-CxxC domain-containing protein
MTDVLLLFTDLVQDTISGGLDKMDNRRERRDHSRPRFGGNRDNFQREMHKAVCAECNSECEVPFKPTAGKPVYCRDCFRKRNPRF